MDITDLIPHIEVLIFASEKPLTTLEITELLNNAFGFMEDKIPLDQVESAMEGVIEKYKADFYPFEVRESGGGWQFLTKKDYHKTIAQLNGDKFMKRLSAAALETLAIVAYKQPVTKGEIEAIRGVSADYAIQKLLEKELVVISGRNEKLPGHPLVYSTSKSFMDYFGINSADDLPKIKEVLAEQMIQPTAVDEQGNAPLVSEQEHAEQEGMPLAVAESGELIEQLPGGETISDGEEENMESVDDSNETTTNKSDSTLLASDPKDDESDPDDHDADNESTDEKDKQDDEDIAS